MPAAIKMLVLRLSLIIGVIVFISGCGESAKKRNSVSLYVDAVALVESNEPNRAVEKLEQAVEKSPDFAMAYSLLGKIYLQQNKLPESTQAYQKAVELNPWSFEDFRALGRVYQLMCDFPSAAVAYTRACELDAQSCEVQYGAAEAYYKLGDYESALAYGKAAKGLAPKDSETERLIGDICSACSDNEMAIEAYRRSLELKGSNPKAMLALAVAYLRTDQYDSAKQLLGSIVAAEPNNAEAWRHLGFVYLKQREMDTAVQKYLKAIEINPDDWRAHKGLGVAYMMKYGVLKSLEDSQAPDYRNLALRHWSRSLDLNPAQDKLLKLYRKYMQ